MQQKQIKQTREAVRQTCWYKLKKKLENPWINFNYGPEELGLEGEQQSLYWISKANLSALKGDLESPHGYLSLAYRLLTEDLEKIASKRKMWQKLDEKERREIMLSAYMRTSNEATRYNQSDEEHYQNQRRIGQIESELNRGQTEPEYNLCLLKKLNAAIKDYYKKIDSANEKPYMHKLKQEILERQRTKLETILTEEK